MKKIENGTITNVKMNKKYNLDADELEVINQIEKGEFSEDLTELENLKLAAKNTVEKNERVNLRINEKDLLVIKRKATENGLPYQSLINVLIHQYAEGKITLSM